MSDLFTRMCCRMDVATVRVMGKQAEINGVVYDVMPEEESAEMGALSGSQLSLVVFSARYRPARHDVVVFAGRTLTVTRYDTYNGKPRILSNRNEYGNKRSGAGHEKSGCN